MSVERRLWRQSAVRARVRERMGSTDVSMVRIGRDESESGGEADRTRRGEE
jgi:hypothetical protein